VKRVLNTCVDIYNAFVLTTNILLENIGRVKYQKIITLTIKPTKQILLDKYTSFCRQIVTILFHGPRKKTRLTSS